MKSSVAYFCLKYCSTGLSATLLTIPLVSVASPSPIPDGYPSTYPTWWFARDVIPRLPAHSEVVPPSLLWPTHYPSADDHAVANQGQLKLIASKAAAEMNDVLPGGAGSIINNLVTGWGSNPVANDYIAINQGQLKYVASAYYDRLFQLGYTGIPLGAGTRYPWSVNIGDDDDFALANLGQLKQVFSFRVPGGSGDAADSDSDGMPDVWEFSYWGVLGRTGALDFDSDGASDYIEYRQGRNPVTGVIPGSSVDVALRVFLPEL